MDQSLADTKIAVPPSAVLVPASSAKGANKGTKAVSQIDKLRDEASNYFEQYENGGRKALYALLAKVYSVYHKARTDDKVKELAGQVQKKLEALGTPPSKTADVSTMLVRYVFKDPDAKQVSTYAKAMRVLYARTPCTAPAEFVDAVNKQKGGISGFTEVASGKTSKPKITPGIALTAITNTPTIASFDVEWGDDEEYRVYVAVRGDDDDAELKHVELSKEQFDAVLVRHVSAQAKAAKEEKKAKSAESASLQLELAKLEEDASKAKTLVFVAKKDLEDAKKASPRGDHSALEKAVEHAKADHDIRLSLVKAQKSKMKSR